MSRPVAYLFLLFLTSAHAADRAFTLNDVLSEVSGSPRVQQAESAAEEAKWGKVESYSGFLPTVNALGTHLLGKRFALIDVTFPGATNPISIPQILSTTSVTLNAEWIVFDGFANFDRYKAAAAFERSSESLRDWTRFQAEREAILLFYRALASRTLKEVAEQNLKTLDDHLEDAQLLKRSGEGTKFEVLRVEVQESEAKSELLHAEDDIAISLLKLGEVLGHPLDGAALSGNLPVLKPDDIRTASYNETRRADITALKERVEGLDQLSDASGKHWFPKVGLFGQYFEYNNRNDSWSSSADFREAYNYGVNFTWNIFNGLSDVSKSRQATEQRVQAEKTLEINQLRARNSAEEWRRRFLYNCSVYAARVSDVVKATESVRLARAGRKAGTRTSTDLLDAELELFRARAGQVTSQIGAIEALINLELSTGQKLYEFN